MIEDNDDMKYVWCKIAASHSWMLLKEAHQEQRPRRDEVVHSEEEERDERRLLDE